MEAGVVCTQDCGAGQEGVSGRVAAGSEAGRMSRCVFFLGALWATLSEAAEVACACWIWRQVRLGLKPSFMRGHVSSGQAQTH